MFKKIIKLINKYNKSSNIINDIDKLIDLKIRANDLLNFTLTSPELIVESNDIYEGELIVSFTSYSKRIHDVHLVIESIAQQTIKPNRLILWLDEGEFTLDTIPLILHKQIARGLEIRFCPNYKSYKKLIPTLKLFPNANIITIDDDVLYPHDMIEILYKEHKKNPKYIIGHRAHKMKFTSEGVILSYNDWGYDIREGSKGDDIFLTGVGGILYPVNSLDHAVLNSKVFMDLCPYADDVWFKAMALLNDVKCKKVSDERDFFRRFLLISASQDIALQEINIVENDRQIEKVFNEYNLSNRISS